VVRLHAPSGELGFIPLASGLANSLVPPVRREKNPETDRNLIGIRCPDKTMATFRDFREGISAFVENLTLDGFPALLITRWQSRTVLAAEVKSGVQSPAKRQKRNEY
jgi:hypothetical protein